MIFATAFQSVWDEAFETVGTTTIETFAWLDGVFVAHKWELGDAEIDLVAIVGSAEKVSVFFVWTVSRPAAWLPFGQIVPFVNRLRSKHRALPISSAWVPVQFCVDHNVVFGASL